MVVPIYNTSSPISSRSPISSPESGLGKSEAGAATWDPARIKYRWLSYIVAPAQIKTDSKVFVADEDLDSHPTDLSSGIRTYTFPPRYLRYPVGCSSTAHGAGVRNLPGCGSVDTYSISTYDLARPDTTPVFKNPLRESQA